LYLLQDGVKQRVLTHPLSGSGCSSACAAAQAAISAQSRPMRTIDKIVVRFTIRLLDARSHRDPGYENFREATITSSAAEPSPFLAAIARAWFFA
jgi:hypothetical protein